MKGIQNIEVNKTTKMKTIFLSLSDRKGGELHFYVFPILFT